MAKKWKGIILSAQPPSRLHLPCLPMPRVNLGASSLSFQLLPVSTYFLFFPLSTLCLFRWSENARSCWYCNPDPEKVKQWILGTESAPIITLAVGELMAFVVILGYFVSHEVGLFFSFLAPTSSSSLTVACLIFRYSGGKLVSTRARRMTKTCPRLGHRL